MKRRLLLVGLLMLLVSMVAFASPTAQKHDPGVGFLLTPLVLGMVINLQNLTALFKNFNTIFQEAFNAAKPASDQIALTVPSTAEQEVYAWLGAWPKLREWLGDRVISNLKAQDWTIKNKDWEATIAVPRNKILFDTYSIFRPMFGAMGAAARMHPDEIVADLLNNGFTNKGYDTKTFFATDHPVGKTTYSNKNSGGGSVLSATTFGTALAALKGVTDDSGKPLGVGSGRLILVVPPALEKTAREILNAEIISSTTNVWRGAADLLVLPQLTSATAWFLLAEFNGLRSLIFQQARAPEFVAKEDPQTSDHVFMRKEYLYGVDTIDNAGYGLWQLAYGSAGA